MLAELRGISAVEVCRIRPEGQIKVQDEGIVLGARAVDELAAEVIRRYRAEVGAVFGGLAHLQRRVSESERSEYRFPVPAVAHVVGRPVGIDRVMEAYAVPVRRSNIIQPPAREIVVVIIEQPSAHALSRAETVDGRYVGSVLQLIADARLYEGFFHYFRRGGAGGEYDVPLEYHSRLRSSVQPRLHGVIVVCRHRDRIRIRYRYLRERHDQRFFAARRLLRRHMGRDQIFARLGEAQRRRAAFVGHRAGDIRYRPALGVHQRELRSFDGSAQPDNAVKVRAHRAVPAYRVAAHGQPELRVLLHGEAPAYAVPVREEGVFILGKVVLIYHERQAVARFDSGLGDRIAVVVVVFVLFSVYRAELVHREAGVEGLRAEDTAHVARRIQSQVSARRRGSEIIPEYVDMRLYQHVESRYALSRRHGVGIAVTLGQRRVDRHRVHGSGQEGSRGLRGIIHVRTNAVLALAAGAGAYIARLVRGPFAPGVLVRGYRKLRRGQQAEISRLHNGAEVGGLAVFIRKLAVLSEI